MSTHHDIPPTDDGDLGALRHLVDEVRAEPLPQLDWEAVEQRLLARVALEAAARRRQRLATKPSWPGVLGLVAAAAAVVLLLTHVDPGHTHSSPAAVAAVDLSALTSNLRDGQPTYAVGDLSDRSVVERGRAGALLPSGVVTWTLSPAVGCAWRHPRAHLLTLEQSACTPTWCQGPQRSAGGVLRRRAAGTRRCPCTSSRCALRRPVNLEVTRIGDRGARGSSRCHHRATAGRTVRASFGLDGRFRES